MADRVSRRVWQTEFGVMSGRHRYGIAVWQTSRRTPIQRTGQVGNVNAEEDSHLWGCTKTISRPERGSKIE